MWNEMLHELKSWFLNDRFFFHLFPQHYMNIVNDDLLIYLLFLLNFKSVSLNKAFLLNSTQRKQ